jgi:hypothetical protein
MRRIITTYVLVVVLLSLGIFGIGALASAQELRDPMQPPPFALQKFRQAKWASQPRVDKPKTAKPKPLQLTSILYSKNRKIAIIDDQMLAVGDRIRGARLVKLTRATARLVRNGKVINLNLGNDLTAIKKKVVESDL